MPSTLRIEAPTFYPGARTLPSPPSSVPSPVDDTWATFALSFRTRDGEGQVAVAYSTTPPIEILQTENMRKLVSGKGVHGVVELGQTGRKEVETVLANLAPVFASGWTIQASAPYTARFHSRGEAGVKRIAALHAVCQRWTSGLRDGEAALHFLSALNAGLGGVFPVSVGATASLRVAIQLVRERRFGAGARTIRQVEYVEEGDAGMVPVTPMALLAERRRREFQESERVVRLPLAGL